MQAAASTGRAVWQAILVLLPGDEVGQRSGVGPVRHKNMRTWAVLSPPAGLALAEGDAVVGARRARALGHGGATHGRGRVDGAVLAGRGVLVVGVGGAQGTRCVALNQDLVGGAHEQAGLGRGLPHPVGLTRAVGDGPGSAHCQLRRVGRVGEGRTVHALGEVGAGVRVYGTTADLRDSKVCVC